MSKLSKRNLKGGKSSRKSVKSHKRRTQRGGNGLTDPIFADLLSKLLLLLEKGSNNNNNFSDMDNLLNGCSITQLGIVYSIVKQNQNKFNKLYTKIIQLIDSKKQY